MFNHWFKVAIKFVQVVEDDKVKTVIEEYLYQAMSYADAEYKATEEFGARNNDFEIHKVTKINLAEVFTADRSAEPLFFEAKVHYIIFDEKTKQEKRTSVRFLIDSDDVQAAILGIKEKLGAVDDYEITDIKKTKILEVFFDETELPEDMKHGHFVPLPQEENANQIEEPEA